MLASNTCTIAGSTLRVQVRAGRRSLTFLTSFTNPSAQSHQFSARILRNNVAYGTAPSISVEYSSNSFLTSSITATTKTYPA